MNIESNSESDYMQELLDENAGVIAWAALEGARSGMKPTVVMLVDLGAAEPGEHKVIDFFEARVFGRVAAAPISMRHATGLASAAVANPKRLLDRLRAKPPEGCVHVLVISRAFGGVVVAFGRSTIHGPYLA